MNTACLKKQKLDTYILFQETYHKESYQRLHPTGPKSDYNWHTEAMDRAMEGGIDDVGLGVLFGLEGYRYEFAGLLMHAEHLEAVHGVGPHTISVPRVKPAMDINPDEFDNGIPDEVFEKLIALIRISVPYTGMIIRPAKAKLSANMLFSTEFLKLVVARVPLLEVTWKNSAHTTLSSLTFPTNARLTKLLAGFWTTIIFPASARPAIAQDVREIGSCRFARTAKS